MEGFRVAKAFQPSQGCSRQVLRYLPGRGPSPRSEMNSSVGDLGVGGCSLWDDPARFIVVPAAYALALGLGLPANVAALAVFIRSGGRLGQALLLYLFNLALADELFTLTLQPWLIYYLGLARRPPAARLGPPTTCPPTTCPPTTCPPTRWSSPRSSACAAVAPYAAPGPGRLPAWPAPPAPRAHCAPSPGWRAWPLPARSTAGQARGWPPSRWPSSRPPSCWCSRPT
uniref:G-protein coupled receptors family 1 profile domain-containing protein n=1 Tax=Papio anubis TaxID=9555 RepID=A0A2I3LY47_PAPAN